MSTLTLLTSSAEKYVLCKTIGDDRISDVKHLPYKVWRECLDFHSLRELRELLEALRVEQNSCVVRAAPIDSVATPLAEPCRRLLHVDSDGSPATLEEVPRDWVMIDSDNVEPPKGLYFTKEPARAAEYVRSLLPPEFRAAGAVWHVTNSAGFKAGLRLHLWFRLSHELHGGALQEWLRDAIGQRVVDPVTLRPAQAHFTADPIFEDGVECPFDGERMGTLEGCEEVEVPADIVHWKPAVEPPSAPTGYDPMIRAALSLWAAENGAKLEGYQACSVRYPCPACGSSDGIAVRGDGRWNCHGGKHASNAPDVGSATGAVYVGHPIEFVEGIEGGVTGLREWLKTRYPKCFSFGDNVIARLRTKNAEARAKQLTDQLSAMVEGGEHGGDVETLVAPTVRELSLALDALTRAAKVAKGNPEKLLELSVQLGKYVPTFLSARQVTDTLLDAALQSAQMITRPEAEQAIERGLAVGRENPVLPRARLDIGLSYDEQGRLLGNYANTLALCGEPDIAECVVWNERALQVWLTCEPPWRPDSGLEYPRALADADHSLLAAYLAGDRFRYPHATPERVATAIETVAASQPWDPVQAYLSSLHWEGTLDEARELLQEWLITLCGAEDSTYTRAVSMRWMIAAVQRAFEPGCISREVLTLIGEQRVGKSSLFSSLCRDQSWFVSTCAADGSNAAREVVIGAWIIELDEVDKLIKDDGSGALKSFLSTRSDKFRRAYARAAGEFLRRCVFGATSNEKQLFRDPTGASRFNVVHVKECLHTVIEEMRDDLWAAAVALYKANEPAFLQPQEFADARVIQQQAYRASTADELIRELWSAEAPKKRGKTASFSDEIDLGFQWSDKQVVEVDGCRRFKVLATSQILAFLKSRGALHGAGSFHVVNQVCLQLGLEACTGSRGIKEIADRKCFRRPEYS